MELLLSCYDINENLLCQEKFDGHAFYEASFWQTSDKLGITKMGIEMKRNSKEALELRRHRKITEEEKNKTLASSKLKADIKAILEIAMTDFKRFEGEAAKDIISMMSGLKIGNLEDINSFLEDNDLSNLHIIEFKKI